MANIEKSVSIIFGGKDEISGVAKTISGALGDLGGAVDKTADFLAGFAEGMLKVEAAVAALAAGTLALAVKEAGNFGDQINEISTLTGASAGNIDSFREQILNYSRDSKKSIEDINSAVNTAIKLGVDYKDSLKLIGDIEKLSVATKSDLKSSTELVAESLNAYGKGLDQAAHFSDVFFTITRAGKATIPELAGSIGKVASIAASAGIPLETLGASIMALTSSGMSTSESLTGLRMIISSIINPSDSAAKSAKAMGLEFNANVLRAKGLAGVLRDIINATGGSADKIADLGFQSRSLNTIFTLASDKSGIFKMSLDEISNSAGSTEAAYKKMADNFAGINQNLANNVKATFIDLGEPLLKSYGSIAEGITEIFKGISVSFDSGTFQPVFDELNGFAEKVSEFFKGVAVALPEALSGVDFLPIIDALKSLGGAATDFLDGFDPTKPRDLAKAIQFVIDSISSMITVTGGMVEQFKPLWYAIEGTIERFNSSDEASKKSVGNILALSIEIKNFGKTLTLVLGIMNWFGVKIESVFNYFSDVTWRVGNMVSILKDLATLDFEGLKKDFYNFFYDSKEAADNAAHSARSAGEAWWAAGESATSSSAKFGDAAKNTGKLTDETSKSARMAEEFKQVFGDASSGISSAVDSQMVPAIKKVSDESEKTKKNLESLPQKVRIGIELQKANTGQFEAETKRLSSMLDFKAKIDVSTLENETKRVEAIFDSINLSVKDTGIQLSDLFKFLLDSGATGRRRNIIEKQIDEENSRRDEVLELQRETIMAQIDLMKSRTKALDRGDAIIKVSGDGLAPYLEAFMWQILEAIQVRASQEGLEMLLGATA
jgi:TP901 family phage tail tape measure protein